jgi:hypothetical protein
VRTFVLWLLLTTTAGAVEEPDEVTKKRALMLGYMLNGNSMVRYGSFDVQELLEITRPQTPVARVIPMEKKK